MSAKYKAVIISGVALDSGGYRFSPGVYKFDLCIMPDGRLFDQWHGTPFSEIKFDGVGLDYGAGSFVPSAGEIERLKKLGAKIPTADQTP